MLRMAKKKTRADAGGGDRHKNPVISFRPPRSMREAIERLASADRRSLSQMVELLVEAALAARGEWPPQAEGGRP